MYKVKIQYPNAENKEITKPNKNTLGKIALKNLLACSLESEENTIGETTIIKKSIAPSKAEFKYEIKSSSINNNQFFKK